MGRRQGTGEKMVRNMSVLLENAFMAGVFREKMNALNAVRLRKISSIGYRKERRQDHGKNKIIGLHITGWRIFK